MKHESTDKPIPPADMWEEIAIAVAALPLRKQIPKTAFTRTQFMARFKLGRNSARTHLLKLQEQGLLERCGSGNFAYYVWKGKAKEKT